MSTIPLHFVHDRPARPFHWSIILLLAVLGVFVGGIATFAGGYSLGYMDGYDVGFGKKNDQALIEAANATPVDWGSPENQEALKRAFPAAFPEATHERD